MSSRLNGTLVLFNLSFIMKSSLGEFCFRLLPYYPLGIVTCVLFILILFIISSCRIYEKKKGQIFLIIGAIEIPRNMKAASIVNEAYFDGHHKYFHFWGRFLYEKSKI